jgi:hypothetical protein
MSIGDNWQATCFKYSASASMSADSDGGPKLLLGGGGGAAAVSCGCSVAPIPGESNSWAHACFECGVGVQVENVHAPQSRLPFCAYLS